MPRHLISTKKGRKEKAKTANLENQEQDIAVGGITANFRSAGHQAGHQKNP